MGAKQKRKCKKRNRSWHSSLGVEEIGDYLFFPLTRTKELRFEGYCMMHCVATYEELCRLELARVFSVRELYSNRHIATLSLIWEEGYWQLDQLKGFKNADVMTEHDEFFDGEKLITSVNFSDLYFATQELVLRYREAWGKENAWYSIVQCKER